MDICLFGAGKIGKEAYDELRSDNKIVCFYDNSPLKIGTEIEGIPVCSPDRIADDHNKIIITSAAYVHIEKQLEEMGITDYKVWFEGHLYNPGRKDRIGFKRCSRCIMNNQSDDTILFDDEGVRRRR